MAAKKKTARKKANGSKAAPKRPADPREPKKPTPAAMKETLEQVRAVLDKLTPPEEPHEGDLIYAMEHIFLAEDLSDGIGQEAVRRIETGFVDRNEFRVTEAFEVAELLADLEIPDLFDRCHALREAIGQVYNDQNGVSLAFLREASVTDRNQIFQRVPAITPPVVKFLVSLLSFEECIFSSRSTVRVMARMGFDAKAAGVTKFFEDLREMLAPWGHLPLRVGADRTDGRPIADPVLSPASLLVRLGPPRKK
jgi:hypothetical protein